MAQCELRHVDMNVAPAAEAIAPKVEASGKRGAERGRRAGVRAHGGGSTRKRIAGLATQRKPSGDQNAPALSHL